MWQPSLYDCTEGFPACLEGPELDRVWSAHAAGLHHFVWAAIGTPVTIYRKGSPRPLVENTELLRAALRDMVIVGGLKDEVAREVWAGAEDFFHHRKDPDSGLLIEDSVRVFESFREQVPGFLHQPADEFQGMHDVCVTVGALFPAPETHLVEDAHEELRKAPCSSASCEQAVTACVILLPMGCQFSRLQGIVFVDLREHSLGLLLFLSISLAVGLALLPQPCVGINGETFEVVPIGCGHRGTEVAEDALERQGAAEFSLGGGKKAEFIMVRRIGDLLLVELVIHYHE